MKNILTFIAGAFLFAIPAFGHGYTVLIWGDSLSSGYGIPDNRGWADLFAVRVKDRGIRVVNGSIPGEITQGGKERIGAMLSQHSPELVVLALGSNDGLQGLDTSRMHANLESMINASRDAGARVLLLGMRIPPNYGTVYADAFYRVFPDLARNHDIGFVPFFLEPVALDFDLMQDDGLHPTAEAQILLLEHIWPALQSFLPAGP